MTTDGVFTSLKVLTLQKSGQFAAQMSQMALFIGINLIPKVLKFWIFREKAFLRGLQSL